MLNNEIIRDEEGLEQAPVPGHNAETPAASDAASFDTGRPTREGGRAPFVRRKKVCAFCVEKATDIDYKDAGKLRKFITEHGQILPRRVTGTCAYHQRLVTTAIKRARHIALLPYKND